MQQETIGEECREDSAGSWDEDPREEKTGSHRWTMFALAGGGRPKPEMTTAIHDVVSLPQCIVNSGPRASLDLTFRAIFDKSVLLAKMGTIDPQVLKSSHSR
jgi:hypothetical protein